MHEYKDDSKHKMKIHKHDVCEKAILDSNCCIPPPLMSVNVNVTINRPPLSFVHTSKYSSIIPAGFHEFVDVFCITVFGWGPVTMYRRKVRVSAEHQLVRAKTIYIHK